MVRNVRLIRSPFWYRSASLLTFIGLLSVRMECNHFAFVSIPMTKIELCGRGTRCTSRFFAVAPLLPAESGGTGDVEMESRSALGFASASFFVRRVMTRCAPRLTLTIFEPRTTSMVLSECSEM